MPHFVNAYIYFQYSLVHLMAFKLRDKSPTVVRMLSPGENEVRTWQRNSVLCKYNKKNTTTWARYSCLKTVLKSFFRVDFSFKPVLYSRCVHASGPAQHST